MRKLLASKLVYNDFDHQNDVDIESLAISVIASEINSIIEDAIEKYRTIYNLNQDEIDQIVNFIETHSDTLK